MEGQSHESGWNERRHYRGGIVWPLILIGAGIIFLLNNTGVLNWNVWWTLARLWPVILIAVGLDILIGRRSLIGSLLVAVLVLGVLAAAVLFWTPAATAGVGLTTQQINQGLEGATNANVNISVGTANLTLKEGAEAAGLVQGTITLANGERLESPQFTRNGDTANYRLHVQGSVSGWPGNFADPGISKKSWDLQFNPDVPLSLKMDGGIGNANVDLSRMKITRLDMNAGVGNIDVTLPRNGKFSVSLDAGVGNLHLTIPAGMAVRIQVDRGLGGLDVNGNLQRRGENEYVSPGYDGAVNRADVKLNGGIGRVTIDQQAG